MRSSFVDSLRCPSCRAERTLRLGIEAQDAREVRADTLTCRRCAATTRVDDGIVDLRSKQPDFVTREAAGLERFADFMRASGWTREDVLQLPYREDGYWYAQATAMQQMLGTPDLGLQQGMRILDVGSNTCWATAMFAERGLDAVALDIATAEMQGLKTADSWFEAEDVYFERVLGSMFDTNLRTGSFDFVWCCEVLHHNHLENLRATLVELHRILKPGGKLLVVNEPLRTVADPEAASRQGGGGVRGPRARLHPPDLRIGGEGGGIGASRCAGRGYIHSSAATPSGSCPQMSALTGARAALAHAVRRSPTGRRLALSYLEVLHGASLALHDRRQAVLSGSESARAPTTTSLSPERNCGWAPRGASRTSTSCSPTASIASTSAARFGTRLTIPPCEAIGLLSWSV